MGARIYRERGGSVRSGVRSDLRDARLVKGLTLSDVARVLDMRQETVGRAEVGTASRSTTLRVLAAVMAAPAKMPATPRDAVRAARLAAGLTQVEFADLLRTTANYVRHIERGRGGPGPRMRARLWVEGGCDLSRWHADGFDDADRGDPGPRVAVEVCCG